MLKVAHDSIPDSIERPRTGTYRTGWKGTEVDPHGPLTSTIMDPDGPGRITGAGS